MLKHELLTQDGGAAIYLHYGLNPDLRKKQTNPFRQNSTNFSITCKNGTYLFRDWASDDKGDAIKFLELLLGITWGEAFKIAQSIYGKEAVNINPKIALSQTLLPTVYPSEKQLNCLNHLNSNFHRFCLQIGISAQHLKKWQVGTYLNGKTVFALQNEAGKYLNLKSVFYNEQGKRTTDIYSLKKPQDENGNPTAEYKFCLFGEHLLDKEKQRTVCLVESEKTAVIGSWFYPEYDWLALGSANGLSHEKIPVLFNRKILFLCDADEAGRSNSSLDLLAHYQLNFTLIDLFPEYGLSPNCKFKGYDIADYIIDHLVEYQNFQRLALKNPNYFTIDKYLAELLANERFEHLISQDAFKLNIQAGTGTGKTTLAKQLGFQLAAKTGNKVIIAVPLNAIAETKYEETKTETHLIPYFVSANFSERNLADTLYHIDHFPVFFCNYDALPKLADLIGENRFDLIIDEQHCLQHDFGFRAQKVSRVFEIAQSVERCILFSADTVQYGFEDFQFVKISQGGAERKISLYQVESPQKVFPALIQQIKQTKGKKMVLLNSKKQLDLAVKLLGKDYRVHILKSDIGLANDVVYQSLMREKKFPPEVDVLLCTSVIATGIDIYADEPITMMYVENRFGFDQVLCNQFFARIRNMEKAQYQILAVQSITNDKPILPNQLYQQKLKLFQRLKSKLDLIEESYLQDYALETPYAEKLKVFYRDSKGQMQINKLAVSYWVKTKIIEQANPLAWCAENQVIEEMDASLLVQIKLTKEAIKAQREKNEQIIYDLFVHQRTELAQALISFTQEVGLKQFLRDNYPSQEKIYTQHILRDKTLADIAEIVFKRVYKLAYFGLAEQDYTKLIFKEEERVLQANAKFAHTSQSLQMNLALNEPMENLSVLDSLQIEQYEAIKNALKTAFQRKNSLTNTEIQTIVNQCYCLHLSKHKATQLARILFDLKIKVTTEGDKKLRYYVYLAEKSMREICRDLNINEQAILDYREQTKREAQKNARKKLQSSSVDVLSKHSNQDCSFSQNHSQFNSYFGDYLPKMQWYELADWQKVAFGTYFQDIQVSEKMECPF